MEGLGYEDTGELLKSPLSGYRGSKAKALKHILPMLPDRHTFVDVFGGTGVVLLNRRSSLVEVYNDKCPGLFAFFYCLGNPRLRERIEMVLYSREEFLLALATWRQQPDVLERAARWYTCFRFSIGNNCHDYGRSTSWPFPALHKRDASLARFEATASRMASVQLRNQDWADCLEEFDGPETVFYLDPPYIGCNNGGYDSVVDHREMLNRVYSLQGFAAVSGFQNPLYDAYPWDDKISWQATANCEVKAEGSSGRKKLTECLWIKEAQ